MTVMYNIFYMMSIFLYTLIQLKAGAAVAVPAIVHTLVVRRL